MWILCHYICKTLRGVTSQPSIPWRIFCKWVVSKFITRPWESCIEWSRPGLRTVVVLDDVMDDVYEDRALSRLFTGRSHRIVTSRLSLFSKMCSPRGVTLWPIERTWVTSFSQIPVWLGNRFLIWAGKWYPWGRRAYKNKRRTNLIRQDHFSKLIIDAYVRHGVCARRSYRR